MTKLEEKEEEEEDVSLWNHTVVLVALHFLRTTRCFLCSAVLNPTECSHLNKSYCRRVDHSCCLWRRHLAEFSFSAWSWWDICLPSGLPPHTPLPPSAFFGGGGPEPVPYIKSTICKYSCVLLARGACRLFTHGMQQHGCTHKKSSFWNELEQTFYFLFLFFAFAFFCPSNTFVPAKLSDDLVEVTYGCGIYVHIKCFQRDITAYAEFPYSPSRPSTRFHHSSPRKGIISSSTLPSHVYTRGPSAQLPGVSSLSAILFWMQASLV